MEFTWITERGHHIHLGMNEDLSIIELQIDGEEILYPHVKGKDIVFHLGSRKKGMINLPEQVLNYYGIK